MYVLKEFKIQEQQITSAISLIYNNEIEIGNSNSMEWKVVKGLTTTINNSIYYQ